MNPPAENACDYITMACFRNETSEEMTIHLEMIPDEIVLSPGHQIELLASPVGKELSRPASEAVHPLTVNYLHNGIQVYPSQEADPDWHIRFEGRIFAAGQPKVTRLADLELTD
jgi:hypothetical protein